MSLDALQAKYKCHPLEASSFERALSLETDSSSSSTVHRTLEGISDAAILNGPLGEGLEPMVAAAIGRGSWVLKGASRDRKGW